MKEFKCVSVRVHVWHVESVTQRTAVPEDNRACFSRCFCCLWWSQSVDMISAVGGVPTAALQPFDEWTLSHREDAWRAGKLSTHIRESLFPCEEELLIFSCFYIWAKVCPPTHTKITGKSLVFCKCIENQSVGLTPIKMALPSSFCILAWGIVFYIIST